jgi:hypothetical protein
MRSDRTAYFREYARANADKRKVIKDAWRARNKAKIAAYARQYRAEHADEPRKPGKPRQAYVPRVSKPKDEPTKEQARISLCERFAAFRAKKLAAV